jgi:hypothetical protein
MMLPVRAGSVESNMCDIKIAQWYINKFNSARDRGIDFSMSIVTLRNISLAKKCYFTGLPLDDKTRTIDRVDNKRGYVKGNVVACHTSFNSLKSLIENPINNLDMKTCIRGLTKWREF